MGTMRKDYVANRFLIVLPDDKAAAKGGKRSPFAPGNESQTNPSVLSLVIRDGMLQRLQDSDDERVKGWSVRVFEAKNPLVSVKAKNAYSDRPHYTEPAYGYHYIVVASPNQDDDFSTMSVEQWSNILVVIQDRLRWLYTRKGVTYVSIYADHGADAGGTDPHPHLHMVTFSMIPPVIETEAEVCRKVVNERGVCPVCQIVSTERSGPRQILQTDGFIAFSPWSPSYPYEFWISPTKHSTCFSKITQKEIADLSLILRATLGGLAKTVKNVPYNIVFHLSPEKKNSKHIHWHLEIYPVTKPRSGLERGYGVFVSGTSPEDAAKELGASCRKELAALVGIE